MSTVEEQEILIRRVLQEKDIPTSTQEVVYPFLLAIAVVLVTPEGPELDAETLEIMQENTIEQVPIFEGRQEVIDTLLRSLPRS